MDELRRWFRLRNVERDVEEELTFYFDEAVRELEAQGMTRSQARAEAQRRFGDERYYRRELLSIDRSAASRQRWSWRWDAMRDIARHAVRSTTRAPALTAGIVLAFALGIGANATMYATVERLLLTPPAHIEDPAAVRRLFVHRDWNDNNRTFVETLTYPDYIDFTRVRSFSHVAAQSTQKLTVGHGADAEIVHGVLVTASYWPLLGVEPALGRFFTETDDKPNGAQIIVISHGYWQRRFGGSMSVLGQTVDFGHGPYTIIGVTPKGFTGIDLAPVDLFLPLQTAYTQIGGDEWRTSYGWYWTRGIARLAPGVSLETAQAEATAVHRAARAAALTPEGKPWRYDTTAAVVAAPLLLAQGPNAPSEVAVARWLLGVAVLVLLIACLNVANLLLARMIRQKREISIRLALGIARWRLVAQVIAEGVVLALLGGVAALLLATWGGTLVQRTLLPDVNWTGAPTRGVIALVLGLSLLAGLLSALVPAVQAGRRHVIEGLRTTSGGIARSTARVRAGLSAVQAALSVILLVGAGLFVRSLDSVKKADLGLQPWDVALIVPVFESTITPEARAAYYEAGLQRLTRLGGVAAATFASGVPFYSAYATDLRVPGLDSIPRAPTGFPTYAAVTPDYFKVLDVDLRQGRLFNENDTRISQRVVILSESFARALWPDGSALGKCMHIGVDDPPCSEVVGVVEDARRNQLIEETAYQYYVPFPQMERRAEAFMLRARGDKTAIMQAARRELLALDGRVRFVRTEELQDHLASEMRQWQLGATLFTLFGLLALVVAAIGLYSLLAFDVAQRIREIGLRTALGANSRAIVTLILSRALQVTAAGIAVGGIVALIFAPRLQDMLYQVTPRDPLTFVAVALALGAISLVAAGLPALRAARVDPNVALRAD